MTLDLAQLRRLAEDCQAAMQPPDAVVGDEEFDALKRMMKALTPSVVLELLDRLERAEEKLAERDSVYPTLMTQVGKEQK